MTQEEERNLEFSRQAWGVTFRKPNPDKWITLYAPDTVIYEYGTPEKRIMRGREELLIWMQQLASSFPTAAYEPVLMYGSGKYVTIMWRWTAKLETDFLGVKAKGQNIDLIGMTIWEFNDTGLVQSERVVWNFFSLLEQLGALSTVPPASGQQ